MKNDNAPSVANAHEKGQMQGVAAVAPCSAARHDALTELQLRVEHLMEIVEGVRNERWAADGRRLKDTPEWCALYVARCNLQRLAEEEWKAFRKRRKTPACNVTSNSPNTKLTDAPTKGPSPER